MTAAPAAAGRSNGGPARRTSCTRPWPAPCRAPTAAPSALCTRGRAPGPRAREHTDADVVGPRTGARRRRGGGAPGLGRWRGARGPGRAGVARGVDPSRRPAVGRRRHPLVVVVGRGMGAGPGRTRAPADCTCTGRVPCTRDWSDVVCFAGVGPGEVTAGTAKVVGIAQRRTRARRPPALAWPRCRGSRRRCWSCWRLDPERLRGADDAIGDAGIGLRALASCAVVRRAATTSSSLRSKMPC